MIDSNTNTFFTEGGLHSPLSTGTGYDISFTEEDFTLFPQQGN